MSKTLSATLDTVIALESNSPHYLFEIELDSGTRYFTDNNENISFPSSGGNTYLAWDVSFSAVRNTITNEMDRVSVSFDNTDLTMSTLLASNEFQGKTLNIKKVFSGYLDSASNYLWIFSGEISSPVVDEDKFTVTVFSPLKKIQEEIPRRQYSSSCPWKFGSKECNRFSGPITNLVGHWPLDKAHEVLGTELVTNYTFESDDSSWLDYGTPTTNERSDEQVYSGAYSRKFIVDAVQEGVQSIAYTTVTDVTYRAIIAVYPSSTTINAMMIKGGGTGGLMDVEFTGLSANAWNKITFSAIETFGGTAGQIVIHSGAVDSGTFYLGMASVRAMYTKDVSGNENDGTIITGIT